MAPASISQASASGNRFLTISNSWGLDIKVSPVHIAPEKTGSPKDCPLFKACCIRLRLALKTVGVLRSCPGLHPNAVKSTSW